LKITTEHAASSYGQPVILNDDGELLNIWDGIKTARKKMNMNTKTFGLLLNVSPRTVEDWEQGRRRPRTESLLHLSIIMKRKGV